MATVPEYFGNFPFSPDKKRPVVITKQMMKLFVYPLGDLHNSDLNWIIASTDKLYTGIYQLPPGGTFDPPGLHGGDEPYYILKGTVTLTNPETGQSVTAKEGEAIHIPRGAWHKAYNFGPETARILVMIAPKIWDESGAPDSFPGEMKLYKHGTRED